jgi:hypothetical protein
MVLVTNYAISILKYAEKYNDYIYTPYVSEKFFYRQMRKIFGNKNLRYIEEKIYNQKLCGIKDCIIVFDSNITKSFLKWLKRNNEEARIIFWYWNPVGKSINPFEIPSGIEIWSYSRSDCEKYNLRFNTQFYFEELILEKEESDYDVFFAGVDKGRRKMLLDYQSTFTKLNITYKMEIVSTLWYLKWLHKDYVASKPYKTILSETNRSLAILDLYVNRKAGNSLRVMESIFLGKKLITNNTEISKESFYSPEYIFVLGRRNIKELKSFLEKPVITDFSQIRKYYTYPKWKERFKDAL